MAKHDGNLESDPDRLIVQNGRLPARRSTDYAERLCIQEFTCALYDLDSADLAVFADVELHDHATFEAGIQGLPGVLDVLVHPYYEMVDVAV